MHLEIVALFSLLELLLAFNISSLLFKSPGASCTLGQWVTGQCPGNGTSGLEKQRPCLSGLSRGCEVGLPRPSDSRLCWKGLQTVGCVSTYLEAQALSE